MTTINHQLFTSRGGDQNIAVVIDGELFGARDDHPNWKEIVAGAEAKDPSIRDLFKPADVIARKFAELTERISVHAGEILWDGEPIHNSLTAKILELMEQRVEDWRPLVAFMDKLYTNPNEHSRAQAFDFLTKNKFTITADGNFLAYKGVKRGADGVFYSVNSGDAIVNDEQLLNQAIPNVPGSVIRMPRKDVAHDPASPCHVGLHVAAFIFAKTFGGYNSAVLEVDVSPRDIVSVPDHDRKMRVCRYRVLREVTKPTTVPIIIRDIPEAPPVLVTGGDEVASDEAQAIAADPASIATRDEAVAAGNEPGLTLEEAAKALKPKRRRYPSPDEFEEMRARAKRRKQNFAKYAAKQSGWNLFGDDPTNRKHWEKLPKSTKGAA